MHINVSGLLRNFARVRRAALAGETVVIATRDGNLVLAAQPDPPRRAAERATVHADAALDALVQTRDTAVRNGAPTGELRPAGASRFVSRAVIADAARSAPRIDAERFRADLDALIDPHVDG